MKFDLLRRLATTMLAIACGTVASAQTPPVDSARQINEANELLRGGDVDGAIGAYEKIDSSGQQPLADYNRAIALYRKGERELAADLFRGVATAADDQLAANARYNLGNLHYEQALSVAQQDKQAAIGELTSAISHYRSSLRLRTNDDDARANIELAARLIEQLRQQAEQEQDQKDEQPKKDEQQQDQSEQQNSDDSESESQPGEDGAEQKQQDSEQPSPQESDSSDKSPEESSKENSSESGENDTKQPDESGSHDGDPQTKNDQSEGSDANENKTDDPADPSPKGDSAQRDASAGEEDRSPPADEAGQSDAGNGNESPEGELTSQEQSEAGQNAAASEAMSEPVTTDRMTPEEARKLLQAIRDRDMLRRYGREAAARANRRLQVDKDW